VARAFTKAGVSYAVTGLGAAWLHAHFAGFHTAAFYLRDEPAPTLLRAIGFRDEVRGANVWLAQPNDEGVFTGVAAQEGIQCVHPVQAYVDLAAQPEGAQEAAERLRKKCLRWKTADG
jgi:hypothetical protein